MALQKHFFFVAFCVLFSFLASSSALAKKSVYGFLEPVTLYPDGVSVTAKLDTGANTASLSATDIHVYEKEGKDYVTFTVSHPEIKKTLDYDLPLIRHMKIKGRATNESNARKPHLRPVVRLKIYFDGKPHIIKFNLIDRTHFSTPILLGRKALAKLGVIVDGSARNTILK
ncbi:MAG: RimK/LysX family protein [Nitrosomonas sp.]|nr:RimK/LysX family protein [Nitrosomonas sp.]